MSTQVNIEYHQQETRYYCGAACAQMVLNQSQVGVPHSLNTCNDAIDAMGNIVTYNCTNSTDLCQRCLYEESYNTSAIYPAEDWFSYPDGLTNTLNNHRPVAFARQFIFVLFEETDKAVITQKIVWTIHHYNVAPIVLILQNEVNGGLHWVAVTGYESSSDPVSSDDPGFDLNTISGFWINDPWPSPNATTPPLHSTGDECGGGLVNGYNRGTPHQFFSLDTWINDLIAIVDTGNWATKALAICDPDKAPEKGKKIKEITYLYSGDKLIEPETAKNIAIKSLHDYGLINKDFLPEQIKTPKAATPILVKRIDRANDYYYIIPILGNDNRQHGLVNIDARHGNFKQSAFPKNNGYIIEYKPFSKKEISKLINTELGLKAEKKNQILHKDITISPIWVWKPCEESLSANFPFQVAVYGHTVYYIRVDGVVFTKLSVRGKGM